MKYKTLCRLLLRLLGVYFLGLGLTAAWGAGVDAFLFFAGRYATGAPWAMYLLPVLLRPIAQIAVGYYLFFGGQWVLDKMIPSNRPYCHECGYELTAAAGNICPECGTEFKPRQVLDVEPHH